MNTDNFRKTLIKKLQQQAEKGIIEPTDAFTKMIGMLKSCAFDVKVDPILSNGYKQGSIHLQIPMGYSVVMSKYESIILDNARELFGTRDDTTLNDIVIKSINIPNFAML